MNRSIDGFKSNREWLGKETEVSKSPTVSSDNFCTISLPTFPVLHNEHNHRAVENSSFTRSAAELARLDNNRGRSDIHQVKMQRHQCVFSSAKGSNNTAIRTNATLCRMTLLPLCKCSVCRECHCETRLAARTRRTELALIGQSIFRWIYVSTNNNQWYSISPEVVGMRLTNGKTRPPLRSAV